MVKPCLGLTWREITFRGMAGKPSACMLSWSCSMASFLAGYIATSVDHLRCFIQLSRLRTGRAQAAT